MTKQSAFDTLCDALLASVHVGSYNHMMEFFDKIKAEHAALLAERDALREAINALAPFEVVQGDMMQRNNPHARQMVNTNCVWAVSRGDKSGHKTRMAIERINALTSPERTEG